MNQWELLAKGLVLQKQTATTEAIIATIIKGRMTFHLLPSIAVLDAV